MTQRTHWDDCWRDPAHHECAVGEVERLQGELSQMGDDFLEAADKVAELRDRAEKAEAEVERLKEKLFSLGAMNNPPCFACGYNGAGYYQLEKHPCAARHHAARGES